MNIDEIFELIWVLIFTKDTILVCWQLARLKFLCWMRFICGLCSQSRFVNLKKEVDLLGLLQWLTTLMRVPYVLKSCQTWSRRTYKKRYTNTSISFSWNIECQMFMGRVPLNFGWNLESVVLSIQWYYTSDQFQWIWTALFKTFIRSTTFLKSVLCIVLTRKRIE